MGIDIVVAEIFLLFTSILAIVFGIMNAIAVYAIDMEEFKGGS